MELSKFTEEAVDAIARGASLQDIIDLASEQFAMPLIVTDVGYQKLACTKQADFVDPFWEQIISQGGPTDQTIVDYYIKDGMLDAISKSDGAIYVNWGVCKNYPQTSGPMYIDGNLEGFISILFMDEQKLSFSLELNKTLCRLCTIVMRTDKYRLKHTGNPVREALSQKIFDLEHFSDAPLLSEYKPFLDVEPDYLILRLAQKNNMTNMLSHVKSRILSIYPGILYYFEEQYLSMFLHHYKPSMLEQTISRLLEDYDIFCGCSEVFHSLAKREVYIQQADIALDTGHRLAPRNRLFHYSDYYADSLLLCSVRQLETENALPAELRQLLTFDTKNKTEYIKTLDVYLSERNDINKTAKRLHLHRNTLIYRLGKIKEITALDVNAPDPAWKLQIGLNAARIAGIISD